MTTAPSSPYRTWIRNTLESLYPNPASELNFQDDYELAVAVILSAQCTDKKVNEVTPELFQRFPGFDELSTAKSSAIEKIIRPVNYYRTKAKHLVAMALKVVEDHGGELPRTRDALLALPGVGNKTANVIQSELGFTAAFPVDTHVFRVAKRLGLSRGKNVLEVERDLCSIFPSKYWRNLHHQLIFHGRRVCKARTPLCAHCLLAEKCPTVRNSTFGE